MSIIFNRTWAMPSRNTFSIPPIKKLIEKYITCTDSWIDPFVRNSPFKGNCLFSNDLNPNIDATHHVESLDFLKSLDSNYYGGILFDPPYSPRQITECYRSVGLKTHMEDTQSSFYGDRKKECARILRPNGIVISCGWNSGGIGKSLGFDIIEILLVPHGGAHNDTIVTVEKKSI